MRHLLLAATLAVHTTALWAQDKPSQTIFTNVNVFDGVNEQRIENANVLVEGNLIKEVSTRTIETDSATVIDGGGRTMIPGLIDVHAHLAHTDVPIGVLMTADPYYIMLIQGQAAGRMLQQGFTSFRDVGGPVFGLKRAIDEGVLPGPRIWPSGSIISQTSGHGDFRNPSQDVPAGEAPPLHFSERFGWSAIADGEAAVLRAARENLMRGASQIKLMAGGGVSSNYDPLDVTQFTEDEMRAAVEAAEAWNTYVAVHAYTPAAIQQAIRAGVKSIEHAQLIDEETMKMAVEAGVWVSMQPFLDDEDMMQFPEGSENHRKLQQMTSGTDNAFQLAKKYGAKVRWGTDVQFDRELAGRQGKQLAKMVRWFTPFEVLKMATSDNAELLALSGPRSPYREGPVGIIEEGAYADLILVDGNPLEDIDLIANPGDNFVLIMKDGVIYKNAVEN